MPFDWHRWHKVHRAASRRFSRHLAQGIHVKEAWRRYDLVMNFTRRSLES
jgi:hypothetical protein